MKALSRLRWTFLSGNRIVDISVLAQMAQSDVDKYFAPYWRLYLEDNPLNAEAEAHVETLRQLRVRVKTKSILPATEEEPAQETSSKTR